MTMAPTPKPHYYRHSGRFDAKRTPLALLATLLIAAFGASLYCGLAMHIPFRAFITILLAALLGTGVGRTTTKLLRWAKVRNTPLTLALALGFGLFAVYWAWVTYLFVLLNKFHHPLPIWSIGLHPAFVWNFILRIYATGIWSFNGVHPQGLSLAFLWLIEAAVIMGLATWLPLKKLTEVPFCEACNRWGSTQPLATLGSGNRAHLKTALEQKDFAVLEHLGPSADSDMAWTLVTLQGCSACDTTQTLSVDAVVRTCDDHGRVKHKLTPIIHQLHLTPKEIITLAQVVARANIPPEPSPTISSQDDSSPLQTTSETPENPSAETPEKSSVHAPLPLLLKKPRRRLF